jgi:hypothetical protein
MHWRGTVGGAFQRAGLYESGALDSRKKEFRRELRKELEAMEQVYNESPVTNEVHIQQIKYLQTWSIRFKDTLKDGKLNFGISQKLLNLHLKGVWCFNLLNYAPPHFPVDRIIQQRLGISPISPWTRIKDETEYLRIIMAAERIASEYKVSLPELELRVYNGTLKIAG